MSGDKPETPENPPEEAVFRPSRWPGLIWAVPIAALAIIAWLGISAWVQSGPSVVVTLPVAGGLKPGNTKVEYQGYVVGHVGDVSLTSGLDRMRVEINFDAEMAGHLGPGTQYWLQGNSLSLAHISDIKDLISGPVIGVDPRPGKTVRKVRGLTSAPVLQTAATGLTLTLFTPELGHVSAGSPVYYKGFQLGRVLSVALSPDGQQFTVRLFITAPWQKLVTANTRFWNAGAIRLSAGGGGPGVQLVSVPALFMGAIEFETPGGPPAAPARNNMRFKLYNSEAEARDAPSAGAVTYRAIFPGGPHGLQAGAPVQLEGSPAGSVVTVGMRYDSASGKLYTIVTLVLQPQRIGLAAGSWNLSDPAPQMNAMLGRMIGEGLRAELGSSVPVIGGKLIQLEMVKDAPPAALVPGDPPVIPVFGSGGGDVNGILMQVNDILASVNAMPLDQIAANIHNATSRLAALAKSPQTKQTLRHLDRTIAHIDAITRQTNAQLPAILAGLRQSVTQAQAALQSARGLLSSEGPANAGPESADLPQALYELSQAAQSLRALTDFLTSHPGALIAGRAD